VISVSCHYVTSLEYSVLSTANTYDWIIATADSRISRRICAVIRIPIKERLSFNICRIRTDAYILFCCM
jgi:rRNA-processing protein FCF1